MKKLKVKFYRFIFHLIIKYLIVNDNDQYQNYIINSFKVLQIDSLLLDTKVIKYQKKNKGGSCTGRFMRILEYTHIKGHPCITSELISLKSKKQISFNTSLSLVN